ncbi:hypothetical protein ACKVWM_004127 [Pyricularia oryzae]
MKKGRNWPCFEGTAASRSVSRSEVFADGCKEGADYDLLSAVHFSHQLSLLREDMLGELRNDLQVALGSKYTPLTESLLLSKRHTRFKASSGHWALVDKLRSERPELSQKLATAFDDYCGDDIFIASLTRSSFQGDIGFMAAPERFNVLISRTRTAVD